MIVKKIFKALANFLLKALPVIGLALLIFIGAVIGGTVLYFLWPVAIPAAFPGLIASGVLAAKLTWGQSVCLAWIFHIFFKSYEKAK
jgi:peptidoglycan/LPS O-acetylase OafA/YrhL